MDLDSKRQKRKENKKRKIAAFLAVAELNDVQKDSAKKQKTELNEEAIIETAIAAMDMLEKLKKQLKEQPGPSRQSEKLKNYALSMARCSDEILDHS